MAILLLTTRLFLFGVWCLSALTKLVDLKGSRQALVDFGLPPALAVPIGLFLPLFELASALALLTTSFVRWGALAGSGLLVTFSLAILYNLLHGRRPDCHCFGQFQKGPIGSRTLWRNTVFLSTSLFIAVAGWQNPGISMFSWLGTLSWTLSIRKS